MGHHPLVIGQAAATLDNMFSGKFLVRVGSGEAVNESYFFKNGMPSWTEGIYRLAEAVQLMWKSVYYFSF